MERAVLHCDANSFFASVECLYHPEYRTIPMAVAGDAEQRHGIILAKNEPAKALGVATAETIWAARKKCPELLLVPPRHGEYSKFYRILNGIYCSFTDLVEPFGVDESWLDVTGSRRLFGDGMAIAEQIRRRVREETGGLTVSIGVSFNKTFAKLGSDYKKPDAITRITRENFRDLVWSLPVGALLFIGESAAQRLAEQGISTIGQLALADREVLVGTLGRGGAAAQDCANGLDDSPVLPFDHHSVAKSVGNGTTPIRDLVGISQIRPCVTDLCEQVARRLRADGLRCCKVQVALKDPRFHTIQRQKPTRFPTDIARELIQTAMELIEANYGEGQPIRSVTVTAGNLIPRDGEVQAELLSDEAGRERLEELELTKDHIRERYGTASIRYANTLPGEEKRK